MHRALLVAGFGVLVLLASIGPVVAARTLVYCADGSPDGFNAQLHTNLTTYDASSIPLYNRLVEFERGSTKLVPGLATSWEVADEGQVFTFHLRPGVKFHTTRTFKPTRDFNSDDVLFSFNRQLRADHPFHEIGGGRYESFYSMGLDTLIKAIVRIDDSTVRFELVRAEASFPATLAMDFASIQSAEYADQMMKERTPERIDHEPVGTGPFQLVAYQKDALIRYRTFEAYWGGRAPVDFLVFAITPDATVRYAKLKAGECHVMPSPNPEDREAIAQDPDLVLMNKPALNVGYLAFNTEKKPFDDARVRRALSMAVDTDAIVKDAYQGTAVVARNPIPPTQWGYDDGGEDAVHDPEAARALLAEAGLGDGFEVDLWAMPVQRPYNPAPKRVAEMIQADWARIGVRSRVVSYDWGEYLRRSKDGEHQALLLGWTSDNGDPDNFLYTLLSCDAVGSANRARWCNKPFDELLSKAKQITEVEERTRLYRAAQAIVREQMPWLPLAHSLIIEAARRELRDYRIDPLGHHNFYGVDLPQ